MAGHTTRLNLYKPGGGSSGLILPDEAADVDKLNGNMDVIDAAVGAFICTSATHPATPYDGQIIYETDTKYTQVYRAATSNFVPIKAKAALVFKPSGPINTPTSGPQNTWVTLGNVNVPAGATGATVALDVINLQTIVGPINVNQQIAIGTAQGTIFRIPGSGSVRSDYNYGYTDSIANPPAGSQPLALKTTFQAGGGSLTLDVGSLLTALVDFT